MEPDDTGSSWSVAPPHQRTRGTAPSSAGGAAGDARADTSCSRQQAHSAALLRAACVCVCGSAVSRRERPSSMRGRSNQPARQRHRPAVEDSEGTSGRQKQPARAVWLGSCGAGAAAAKSEAGQRGQARRSCCKPKCGGGESKHGGGDRKAGASRLLSRRKIVRVGGEGRNSRKERTCNAGPSHSQACMASATASP